MLAWQDMTFYLMQQDSSLFPVDCQLASISRHRQSCLKSHQSPFSPLFIIKRMAAAQAKNIKLINLFIE
jgi:hypothetical protein